MDQLNDCFSFAWDNATTDDIIPGNSVSDLLRNQPEDFEVFTLDSQDCKEVEVASTEQISEQDDNFGVSSLEPGEIVFEQWEENCAEEVVGNESEQVQDGEIPLPAEDEYISSKPYPCDFCSRRFEKEQSLINHMAAHKRAPRHYECLICGLGFTRHSELLNHQQVHEDTNTPEIDLKYRKKSFACQLCNMVFSKEKALTSHLRIHEGESPFACKECDITFWDTRSMEEHWQLIHSNIVDYNRTGNSRREPKYGTYCCTTCGVSFCRQSDLKRHQQNHQREELENSESGYSCEICGESFTNALELMSHTEEFHGDGFEYQCMICGDRFIDDEALSEHIQAEHPDSEVVHCKTKDLMRRKGRTRRRRTNNHDDEYINRNTAGVSSDQPFACTFCGKNFTTRSSQQIHMRIHTGERPYACRFCQKAFADGGTLRKHERIHTGEKPYACVICPKAFNQRVVLREHIRAHHSSPDPKLAHSMTPFCCALCKDLFATSQDLIVHLIHHCDVNTARKRPPKIGPRKYVRRRALQPHEYEVKEEQSDEEPQLRPNGVTPKYEIDMDSCWSNRKNSSQSDPLHFEESSESSNEKSPVLGNSPTYSENTNDTETEKPISNKPRAKMIFTEKKKRKHFELPETIQKQHKRNKYIKRSHTNFSLREDTRTKNATEEAVHNLLNLCEPFQNENSEFTSPQPDKMVEKIARPSNENHITATRRSSRRTKGLSSYNRYLDPEYEELDTEVSTKKKHKRTENELKIKEEQFEVCEEQVLYENPEDYIIPEENNYTMPEENNYTIPEENNTNNGNTETVLPVTKTKTILPISEPEFHEVDIDQEVLVKQEMIDPLLEFAEISMQHAKSHFKCEMCSAVFLEKSQLVAHVGIHI